MSQFHLNPAIDDFEVEPAPEMPEFKVNIPIRVNRDFSQLWPRLGAGMRFIVLDHLERYAASAEKNRYDVPGWARFRIKRAGVAGLSGDIRYRLKLKNARRKLEDHIEIQFQSDSKKYNKIPDALGLTHNEKAIWKSLADLVNTPHVTEKKNRVLDGHYQQKSEFYRVETIPQLLIERIPENIRNDVLKAVIIHDVTYYTTNDLGEASVARGLKFGIESKRENDGLESIVPIGNINDHIYFQNGWLMIKLEKMPASIGTILQVGRKIDEFFDVTLNNGIGGKISPFKNLVITKRKKGKTWMGDHVQVKLGNPND